MQSSGGCVMHCFVAACAAAYSAAYAAACADAYCSPPVRRAAMLCSLLPLCSYASPVLSGLCQPAPKRHEHDPHRAWNSARPACPQLAASHGCEHARTSALRPALQLLRHTAVPYCCAAWHPRACAAPVKASSMRLTLCVCDTDGTRDFRRAERAA